RTTRPMLNHAFISAHDHDYLDLLRFLERLRKEGAASLRPQKTVFIFLEDEILSMPYETYDLTLKAFEAGTTLEDYYGLMRQRGIFDLRYHKRLVAKLFENDLLH
ncbi:MAG: hypothetical protein PVJ62_05305, partial [Deltaproteobacteria bacterium]